MRRRWLRADDPTPDAHEFPTRPYDLVREFVIALVAVTTLTLVLAAVFSSPDRKAITMRAWAKAAPDDVVATAVAELAGTSSSASYGPPYNGASEGQKLGPLALQKWAGQRLPVDSANDLVVRPLTEGASDPSLTAALATWHAASPRRRTAWATAYSDALAKAPNSSAVATGGGRYGPVPLLAERFRALAESGGLDSLLTRDAFYATDQTK